jgi:hypothetical protein
MHTPNESIDNPVAMKNMERRSIQTEEFIREKGIQKYEKRRKPKNKLRVNPIKYGLDANNRRYSKSFFQTSENIFLILYTLFG